MSAIGDIMELAQSYADSQQHTSAARNDARSALRNLISAVIADARREGAEQMRGTAACAGFDAAFSDQNACEVMEAICALPLPTGPRQAVLLTDAEALAALPDCHGSSLGKSWLLAAARRANGGKPVAMYRNPADGSTWSGGGLKPKWLLAACKTNS